MNYTYGLSIVQTHLAAGATLLMTSQSMQMKPFWDFFRNNEGCRFVIPEAFLGFLQE